VKRQKFGFFFILNFIGLYYVVLITTASLKLEAAYSMHWTDYMFPYIKSLHIFPRLLKNATLPAIVNTKELFGLAFDRL
jgi:hypothetical protein